jgi:hypothetical protein
MTGEKEIADDLRTLTFEEFWPWVQTHPNCIYRVANPDVALFDDEDFHWHFGVESDDSYLVQVIRGKRFVGEVIIRPAEVFVVRMSASDNGEEHYFDLMDEANRLLLQVTMSHAYEEVDPSSPGRLTH